MLKSSMNPMALPKTRSTSASLRCSGVTADPPAISSDMRIISLPHTPHQSVCGYRSENCGEGASPRWTIFAVTLDVAWHCELPRAHESGSSTSQNSVRAKVTGIAHLPYSPDPEGLPEEGHNTAGR